MHSRILVISQYFENGGLEANLISQARSLARRGVQVFLATGSKKENIPQGIFAEILPNLNLEISSSVADLRAAIGAICNFARVHRTTIVHAHPFYSYSVAYLVAAKLKQPLVATVHGPISLESIRGRAANAVVRFGLVSHAAQVFSVSQEAQFICHIAGRQSYLLPNGTKVSTRRQKEGGLDWLWAGRLDEEKSNGLKELIKKMAGLGRRLLVCGDGPYRKAIQEYVTGSEKYPFVDFIGWDNALQTRFPKCEVIAGMGRVVIEAGAFGRPILLVGYDGVKGFVSKRSVNEMAYSNFSGRGFENISEAELESQFAQLLRHPTAYDISKWVSLERNENVIWDAYLRAITKARPLTEAFACSCLELFEHNSNPSAKAWEDFDISDRILKLALREISSELSTKRSSIRMPDASLAIFDELRLRDEEEFARVIDKASNNWLQVSTLKNEHDTIKLERDYLAREFAREREELRYGTEQQNQLIGSLRSEMQQHVRNAAELHKELLVEKDRATVLENDLLLVRQNEEQQSELIGSLRSEIQRYVGDAAEFRKTLLVERDRATVLENDLLQARQNEERQSQLIGSLRSEKQRYVEDVAELHKALLVEKDRTTVLENNFLQARQNEEQQKQLFDSMHSDRLLDVERLEALQVKLEFEIDRAKAIESNLIVSQQHADQQAQLISSSRSEIEQFKSDLSEARAKLSDSERLLQEQRAINSSLELRVAWLQDEISRATAKTESYKRSFEYYYLQAKNNQRKFEEVHSKFNETIESLSWRSTAVFRSLFDGIKAICYPLGTSPNRFIKVESLFQEADQEVRSSINFDSAAEKPHLNQIPNGEIRPQTVGGSTAEEQVPSPFAASAGSRLDGTRPYRPGLVSIILPIFNQANFIDEAISSIYRQTYANWELILVNDGSTDDFNCKVESYKSEPRVRVFYQPNQKLPSALNNGFREARGEYLTWTSADNVVLENWLERLLDALHRNPHAGLAYSDYTAIDDRGASLADPMWRQHNRPDGSARLSLPKEVTTSNFHESGDNFLGASFMWRAEVHEVVGQHDENTFGGEDYDFWLRMSVITPFIHVAENLYLYRVHENTLNARAKELRLIENVQRLLASDRERRYILLRNAANVAGASGGNDYWRSVDQYQKEIPCVQIRYSDLVKPESFMSHDVSVVDVDVPLREIDLSLIENIDILTTSDALVYSWLRRLNRPSYQRLLFLKHSNYSAPVHHAVALRYFERIQEEKGYYLSSKPPAQPVSGMPRHLMLAVGRWGNGGLEQVVVDLASSLLETGARLTIASCDGVVSPGMEEVCAQLGITPVAFNGSIVDLVNFVKDHNVDFVNYHHASLGLSELSGIGIRTVYTVHNSYIWMSIEDLTALRSGLSSAADFVAVSREVAQYAFNWLGAPPDRINVISNGTTLASPQASVERRHGEVIPEIPQGYRFLNAATFNRVKCQDRLIRAFAPVAAAWTDAHLTLVGVPADQGFYEEILALREQLNLRDRVTVIAGTNRASILELMKSHNCFVLPSIVEGWSISLAEAIISGMPAIISDVGSARDVAAESGAVIVVPNLAADLQRVHQAEMWSLLRDEQLEFQQKLTDALSQMLSSRDVMQEKAMTAASSAKEKFSIRVSTSRYIDMILRK